MHRISFIQKKLNTVKALSEKFWGILLNVIDDAIAKLYHVCDVKFSQIEGNGRTFRHIERSNIIISEIFKQCE